MQTLKTLLSILAIVAAIAGGIIATFVGVFMWMLNRAYKQEG